MVEMTSLRTSSVAPTTSFSSTNNPNNMLRTSTSNGFGGGNGSAMVSETDGGARRNVPLTPQMVSERLCQVLERAFQERQPPKDWARAVRQILQHHPDRRPLCELLLRGVTMSSFISDYLYFAVGTNLIPPLLCLECIPTVANPYNSAIGYMAAEPNSVRVHLRMIADILNDPEGLQPSRGFTLSTPSSLLISRSDSTSSLSLQNGAGESSESSNSASNRGKKRKASEPLDREDTNKMKTNGSDVLRSSANSLLRASSLRSSGLWPIGPPVEAAVDGDEDESEGDEQGEIETDLSERIPGDFEEQQQQLREDSSSKTNLSIESRRISLITLELCRFLAAAIEISLASISSGRQQEMFGNADMGNLSPKERERYAQSARNLVEALRVFALLLNTEQQYALLLIARHEFPDIWDQLYSKLETIHSAGEWHNIASNEGDDDFASLNFQSVSMAVASGFSKLWAGMYRLFSELSRAKQTIAQTTSLIDRPFGIAIPNGYTDNDYRPPLALAYVIEDELVGNGFKTIRCLAKRLEGVRACMGNISDTTFCSELLTATMRAVYRRKSTRDRTKALNLLLLKLPKILRMWQDDEGKDRPHLSTRTFLDGIPRSFVPRGLNGGTSGVGGNGAFSSQTSGSQSYDPRMMGGGGGAGGDDGHTHSMPQGGNFLTSVTSPSLGPEGFTPTGGIMTTPSPGPGMMGGTFHDPYGLPSSISDPSAETYATFNYVEQSILHLTNFPALAAGQDVQDKESASFLYDVAYACAAQNLISWDKMQQVLTGGSLPPQVLTLSLHALETANIRPVSPPDVDFLIETARNPTVPECIPLVMKCLVAGLSNQWQIREYIVQSILVFLEDAHHIPPTTTAALLQAFLEVHVSLELFGDELPRFVKLIITICDWFGTYSVPGMPPISTTGALGHKLFPSAFLLMAYFVELCEMKLSSHTKTRAVMRDILNSIHTPATYCFATWFREYIGLVIDPGSEDITGCGAEIVKVLFRRTEEVTTTLEQQLENVTPWQVIQACPYVISQIYGDLLQNRIHSRTLIEGLKLLMNQARYCIVPLVSYLWNDVTTRSWDLQTKPFAWGIMKALIPELPGYVKDAIHIQRQKIVTLFPSTDNQKVPSYVYRESHKPAQPLIASLVHENYIGVVERVVLSPITVESQFRTVLERTGKRNFCGMIVKEVMTAGESNTFLVGPQTTHAVRVAELGACLLSSIGGTPTISQLLMEILPLWTVNLTSYFAGHILAHFTYITIAFGVYPVLGDLPTVEKAEMELALNHFFLWLTENLEGLKDTLAPSSSFYLTVAAILLGFKDFRKFAPVRRLSKALKEVGCGVLAPSLFELTEEKERMAFYRFVKASTKTALLQSLH